MYKYFTIFIFLFATVIGVKSQDMREADSLLACGQNKLAAVEYERCAFEATSRKELCEALKRKVQCYRNEGRYDKAAETWERCATTQEDYFNYIMCLYLSDQYEKVIELAESCRLLFDSTDMRILLLEVLSLNETGSYGKAQGVAQEMARQSNIDGTIIDSIYKNCPKLKKEEVAMWLSIVPGLGHLYAGCYGKAVTAFLINAAALGFGLWQVFEKFYITAYIGGAGMLSITYLGNFKSANYYVRKSNYTKTIRFNKDCKKMLMEHFSDYR